MREELFNRRDRADGEEFELDDDDEDSGNERGRRNGRGEPDPARARFRELREIQGKLNGYESQTLSRVLRRAMTAETEMFFAHVMREDRSVLDFLDAGYTFLNEPLAEHYGIPGVEGREMRRVSLPAGSPRGGVLGQGAVLLVTSNPTRTSPVKRGLFVLNSILGTPSPAQPAGVPTFEEAAAALDIDDPTIRDVLEVHRRNPSCAACHDRFDPLGLALENFNGLGMWRDEEQGRPIDASGELITGETYEDVIGLKKILIDRHASEFYRCLTEKLLTYALGRGLEYYDEHTVDLIVERLEQHDGRFSVLLGGIIESVPFQQMRSKNAKLASRSSSADGTPGHGTKSTD